MARNNKNKSRLKLRLSRVIPSFNLCRSKNLPINPTPLFPPPPIPVYGQPAPARRSSSLASAVCGCRGVYVTEPDDFRWMRDDSWLVVAKMMPDCDSPPRRKIDSGCDDADGGLTLISTPTMKMKHFGRRRNDKNHRRHRISISSADTWETEQLISPSSDQRRQSIKNKHVINRERQQVQSPPRLSVMRRLVGCRAEGKVRESLAVVKRSVDPYEDFKRSMMEMIMEKCKTEHNRILVDDKRVGESGNHLRVFNFCVFCSI